MPIDETMGAPRRSLDEHPPTDELLFDVRLRPHRSLTQANFRLLFLVFTAAAVISSIPFIAMGAWPVGGFMGLDVAIFYVAFRSNFRAARAYEDVVVTPIELLLAKVTTEGHRHEWRFNPCWVRLHKEEHVEFGIQRLALRSRGHSIEVGGFLGPDAKADFASGLSRALGEARRGPRFADRSTE